MKSMKKFIPLVCCIVVGLFFAQPALAEVPTDAYAKVTLHAVQTGSYNGQDDTRLLCSATNGAFTNTWLIVERDSAKMVAAGALTAFSLGWDVIIKIIPFGTGGYRVEQLRVVAP
jgi:hypothetical protein